MICYARCASKLLTLQANYACFGGSSLTKTVTQIKLPALNVQQYTPIKKAWAMIQVRYLWAIYKQL